MRIIYIRSIMKILTLFSIHEYFMTFTFPHYLFNGIKIMLKILFSFYLFTSGTRNTHLNINFTIVTMININFIFLKLENWFSIICLNFSCFLRSIPFWIIFSLNWLFLILYFFRLLINKMVIHNIWLLDILRTWIAIFFLICYF